MPRIGMRRPARESGCRTCRLVRPYHPLVQRGLQQRLSDVVRLWAGALIGLPFGGMHVQAVYSSGGIPLRVIGRRRRV